MIDRHLFKNLNTLEIISSQSIFHKLSQFLDFIFNLLILFIFCFQFFDFLSLVFFPYLIKIVFLEEKTFTLDAQMNSLRFTQKFSHIFHCILFRFFLIFPNSFGLLIWHRLKIRVLNFTFTDESFISFIQIAIRLNRIIDFVA